MLNSYYQQKYADSPGSFADNWPWSNEYQDTAFGGKTQDNFDEQYNGGGKSVEEPPRLAGSNGAIAERLPIPMALEGRGKNLPAKKNLCEFKFRRSSNESPIPFTNTQNQLFVFVCF